MKPNQEIMIWWGIMTLCLYALVLIAVDLAGRLIRRRGSGRVVRLQISTEYWEAPNRVYTREAFEQLAPVNELFPF